MILLFYVKYYNTSRFVAFRNDTESYDYRAVGVG